MDWKTKARIQNVASLLPESLGYQFYYLIQRHFGRLRSPDPREGLKAGIAIRDMIVDSGRDINDKVFLEIGTGRRINMPIAFWLCGAKKIITVDINPYIKLELIRQDLKYITDHQAEIVDMFKNSLNADRFRRLLHSGKQKCGLRELLSLLDIEYLAPMDASKLQLPANSIDYQISNNVFEHIPPDVIVSILKEGNRLVRDNGLFVHRIDFTDHFAHSDKSITFVNFLQYNDREWEKIVRNKFMYMNRLRVDDMERIFTSTGQRILSLYPRLDPSISELYRGGGLALDEQYKFKSEKTLSTIICWVVSEKCC